MGRHRRYGLVSRWAAALAALAALADLQGAARVTHAERPPVAGTAATFGKDARAAALAEDERASAVRELLDRRAAAIAKRDRGAFLGTVDPAQPRFRARQAALFDALGPVPLADWAYEIEEGDTSIPLPRDYGAPTWGPDVTLRYRLAGFDPEPTEVAQFPTFVQRRGRWYLAADDDFEPGFRTRREIWDLGPVEVVRGRRSLVIGRPGRGAFLRDLASHADAAVPHVTAVWGRDWAQRVVVVVPDDQKELATLLGEDDDRDLAQIAAVAVAELPQGQDGYRPVGNRVLVHRPNFAKLGDLGRRVVLNHEVTHVASRDASAGAVPTWLVEGFADYVGYRDSGLRVRTVARELAAEVRSGRIPRKLPADDEFGGANPRLSQFYEMAWMAARLLVERLGERGLVAFYRELGRAPSDDPQALSRTLRRMLRMTTETFTQAWRTSLRQQLA